MNQQKINEIAVQAGAYWREGYTEKPNGDLAWREKVKVDIVDMDLNMFTKLIVKKFDDILVLEYLDCVGNKDTPAAERVERLREKVKTYFGVEE